MFDIMIQFIVDFQQIGVMPMPDTPDSNKFAVLAPDAFLENAFRFFLFSFTWTE